VQAGRTEPSSADELEISGNAAEIRRAAEWLTSACRQHNLPQDLIERLELCLHEALANVITHGGETALAAPIRLRLEIHLDSASVTVSDAGVPFDPRSVPEKVLPGTLQEASPGGLGLVMIRRSADRIDYRQERGRNHFTFGVRWAR
jgi:serine/threonine-protein kinase RsbW